ncbi:hypothetical protein OQA88_12035 [Cercophora sp. LCS_1]
MASATPGTSGTPGPTASTPMRVRFTKHFPMPSDYATAEAYLDAIDKAAETNEQDAMAIRDLKSSWIWSALKAYRRQHCKQGFPTHIDMGIVWAELDRAQKESADMISHPLWVSVRKTCHDLHQWRQDNANNWKAKTWDEAVAKNGALPGWCRPSIVMALKVLNFTRPDNRGQFPYTLQKPWLVLELEWMLEEPDDDRVPGPFWAGAGFDDPEWLERNVAPWKTFKKAPALDLDVLFRSDFYETRNKRKATERAKVAKSLPPTLPSTPPATIPSTTIPSTTIPSTTIPSTTIPSTTIPSTTIPSTTRSETPKPKINNPSTSPKMDTVSNDRVTASAGVARDNQQSSHLAAAVPSIENNNPATVDLTADEDDSTAPSAEIYTVVYTFPHPVLAPDVAGMAPPNITGAGVNTNDSVHLDNEAATRDPEATALAIDAEASTANTNAATIKSTENRIDVSNNDIEALTMRVDTIGGACDGLREDITGVKEAIKSNIAEVKETIEAINDTVTTFAARVETAVAGPQADPRIDALQNRIVALEEALANRNPVANNNQAAAPGGPTNGGANEATHVQEALHNAVVEVHQLRHQLHAQFQAAQAAQAYAHQQHGYNPWGVPMAMGYAHGPAYMPAPAPMEQPGGLHHHQPGNAYQPGWYGNQQQRAREELEEESRVERGRARANREREAGEEEAEE